MVQMGEVVAENVANDQEIKQIKNDQHRWERDELATRDVQGNQHRIRLCKHIRTMAAAAIRTESHSATHRQVNIAGHNHYR